MLSVHAADTIIQQTALDKALFNAQNGQNTEGVTLLHSIGEILAKDIHADRDFPPYDRVTMDGIAIHMSETTHLSRHFSIENIQAAGKPPLTLLNLQNAIEVMTGAMLPIHCNAVIPYENIDIKENNATIHVKTIHIGQNIHRKGQDKRVGECLILKGTRITSAEIGILATIGQSIVEVIKKPRIAIVSTGDELIDIDEIPQAWQIRRSNVYAIAALLREKQGIEAHLYHFNDDEQAMTQGIEEILSRYDVIVMTGGVSAGKYDIVPSVLKACGVTELFHKVAQRPGKPLWFGQTTSKTVVFGLPGNPISAYMCACRYVITWIDTFLFTENRPPQYISLSEDVFFTPSLTYFLQVTVKNTQSILTAYPILNNNSGDMTRLTEATGFMELPAERSHFHAGELFVYYAFR